MTRRYVVSGRVQGVGFRRFVEREAVRLGLRGFARNLADGRVEVVAQGDAALLASLEEKLRRGPALAQVTDVAIEPLPDDAETFTHFGIRH